MARFNVSAKTIARIIAENQKAIGGAVSADTIKRFLGLIKREDGTNHVVGHPAVAVIDSYLNWDANRRDPSNAESPLGFHAPLPSDDPYDSFVSGMTKLFSETGNIPTSFPLDSPARFGDRLVGDYAFYRPSWRPYVNSQRYTKETMISLFRISKSPCGYTVTDAQDFLQEVPPVRVTQNDRGCIISLGLHLYFIMKEWNGTAIKLGLIFNLFDVTIETPIDHLRGILYASSHLAIYPPAKFFCRRISDPATLKTGPIDLGQIPDPEVRDYLQDPLPEHLQFVPKPPIKRK